MVTGECIGGGWLRRRRSTQVGSLDAQQAGRRSADAPVVCQKLALWSPVASRPAVLAEGFHGEVRLALAAAAELQQQREWVRQEEARARSCGRIRPELFLAGALPCAAHAFG